MTAMDTPLLSSTSQRVFAVYTSTALFVLIVYLAWFIGVWPGPMGEDGYSLIANINAGQPGATGKDPAWLLYALGTYGASGRIEVLMLPLVILQILILTRMIGWVFLHGHRVSAAMLLIFVACTPHILNFGTSIYPDAIFSLAFIALLFEIWLILQSRKFGWWNALMFFIIFPIACFFKGNGWVILIPVFYLIYRTKGAVRWTTIAITLFWTVAIQVGGKIENLGNGHGALNPLILFETVNFMQTKPMKLWENRNMVTDRTKQIVHRHISQEDIDRLYDRDYWDTLWHQNQDRVNFRQMTKKEKRNLRTDFFTYNLWRNIPAFVSSRVNIFLAAALAQGGLVAPDNSKHRLKSVDTKTTYNPFELKLLPKWISKAYNFSLDLRFLLWTPFVGLALLFNLFKKSIQANNIDLIVLSSTLLVQLFGIFFFSIAAEYRYLLIFFYAPLALVPMVRSIHHRTTSSGHAVLPH